MMASTTPVVMAPLTELSGCMRCVPQWLILKSCAVPRTRVSKSLHPNALLGQNFRCRTGLLGLVPLQPHQSPPIPLIRARVGPRPGRLCEPLLFAQVRAAHGTGGSLEIA